MNRTVLLVVPLLLTLLAFLPKELDYRADNPIIYNQFLRDKNQFHQRVQQLTALLKSDAAPDSLRAEFIRCRRDYKRVEWLLDYFQPGLAERVNGPPVPEVEEFEPGQILRPPTGLQVIEPYLFPEYKSAQKDSLLRELGTLESYSGHLEQGVPANQLTDEVVLDAMRMALFRVLTLGITGYDTPETQTGLTESATTLRAVREAFQPYADKLPAGDATRIHRSWMGTIRMLEQATDADQFDRVTFIQQQLYPLCRDLQQARQTLGISVTEARLFLSPTVATISDSGAFQPDHLINFGAFVSTPKKVALGKLLFFDPLLSGNNARSCASCHQPERAFTDGKVKSRAFRGRKTVLRNAPTLLNAGFQNAQFYDLRVMYLEDQAHDVLGNAHEMRSSSEEVVRKLSSSSAYKQQFTDAFPTGLTAVNVRNALACYIRSLTSLNARPDRYLRGEPVSLTTDERMGFNLFLGKARCATCHFFPIYNGFVPPHYEKTESEIIGVPHRPKTRTARIDSDSGRFYAHRKNSHQFAFKTPTVRNIALTAPYMHNGVYQTLTQVIDFYNRGGGQGIGIEFNGQTLSGKPLDLTQKEQGALVAFLTALTDTTGLTNRPVRLPGVNGNRGLNRRKMGGRY